MYKAIESFADIQDNNTIYKPGDVFPRNGVTVSNERLLELSSTNNLLRKPLIAAVEAPKRAEKPIVAEIDEDFMNKPEIAEEKPKKRGRKNKDAE